MHQEHYQNLNCSSGQRRPTVAEARIPVLGLGMDVRSSRRSNRFILTHTLSCCSICTIESVAKDNIVRTQGRVSGRGSRNIIRLAGSRWCRHCLVVNTFREQLVQIVRFFSCSPVPTRLVRRTLRLNSESLLATTLNVEGLGQGKISAKDRTKCFTI